MNQYEEKTILNLLPFKQETIRYILNPNRDTVKPVNLDLVYPNIQYPNRKPKKQTIIRDPTSQFKQSTINQTLVLTPTACVKIASAFKSATSDEIS